MKIQNTVWTIPVMMEKQVQSFNTVVALQPGYVFMKLYESRFLPGVTRFFIQVDTTQGTSCGKVTKTDMRKHIENHPSISNSVM
jgi:hypothetical protein